MNTNQVSRDKIGNNLAKYGLAEQHVFCTCAK